MLSNLTSAPEGREHRRTGHSSTPQGQSWGSALPRDHNVLDPTCLLTLGGALWQEAGRSGQDHCAVCLPGAENKDRLVPSCPDTILLWLRVQERPAQRGDTAPTLSKGAELAGGGCRQRAGVSRSSVSIPG